MAAAKALVAADAAYAREVAEDDATDSGRRSLSDTELDDMEAIAERLQADELDKARRNKRTKAASGRQAEEREEGQQRRRAQERVHPDTAAERIEEDRRRDRTPSRERRARPGNRKDKKRNRRDRSVKTDRNHASGFVKPTGFVATNQGTN